MGSSSKTPTAAIGTDLSDRDENALRTANAVLVQQKAALARELAAREAAEKDAARHLAAVRLAVDIAYLRPCVGCDKPTWWRERKTGTPRCLKCTPPEGADSVNVCPQKLREYLPPYEEATP